MQYIGEYSTNVHRKKKDRLGIMNETKVPAFAAGTFGRRESPVIVVCGMQCYSTYSALSS